MKKKPFTEKDLEQFKDKPEELNPVYMFSLTHNDLLTGALNKEFDVMYLIRRELSGRGLDVEGNWIGFSEARKLHKIK